MEQLSCFCTGSGVLYCAGAAGKNLVRGRVGSEEFLSLVKLGGAPPLQWEDCNFAYVRYERGKQTARSVSVARFMSSLTLPVGLRRKGFFFLWLYGESVLLEVWGCRSCERLGGCVCERECCDCNGYPGLVLLGWTWRRLRFWDWNGWWPCGEEVFVLDF